MFYLHSVRLLSLVFEMTRRSTTYMLQLVQMKAFELISLLLERVCVIKHIVVCL